MGGSSPRRGDCIASLRRRGRRQNWPWADRDEGSEAEIATAPGTPANRDRSPDAQIGLILMTS
ncbi:MAG: hypothetical protein NZM00_14150, partial [Anaerolinea sp.]|nr:hypothetical protein [Anaerolinea sp.]